MRIAASNFYAYVDNNPVNANDPTGLETIGVISRDPFPGLGWAGVTYGSHSALYVTNPQGEAILFDPAGTQYQPVDRNGDPIRGSGDFFTGKDANLDAYIRAQQASGSTVSLYRFNTTPGQEAEIAARIDNVEGASPAMTGTPLYCAVSCADAIRGIGPFKNLENIRTPGGLEQQFIDLQINIPSSSASGGFLLYPNKSNTNKMRSVYAK